MKSLGYPPGWRDPQALTQHIFGGEDVLAMYESVDEADAHRAALSDANAAVDAPVAYPGFNAPLPAAVTAAAGSDNAQPAAMEVEVEAGGGVEPEGQAGATGSSAAQPAGPRRHVGPAWLYKPRDPAPTAQN